MCRRRRLGRALAAPWLVLLVAACMAAPGPAVSPAASSAVEVRRPVRLVFIGDVMLGRDVGAVAVTDPSSIFEYLRPVLVDADIAFANLESPLTSRPSAGPDDAIEADPAAARLLSAAGLEVLDLANDHATDAGPATVLDTLAATEAVGMRTVGAGADDISATAPVVLDLAGVQVGILAFDLTGRGTAAGPRSPGVSTWDRTAARRVVTALRTRVDLLVVGLHGGVENLPRPDPALRQAGDDLAAWGADVVWGHGAHVAYPVTLADGLRHAVLAPGLGDAVSDQRLAGTGDGSVLEVLADADGTLAMRTGTVSGRAGRAMFTHWNDPPGDAVALRGEWWTPARPFTDAPAGRCGRLDLDGAVAGLPEGSRVVATSCGAVTRPGATDVAVAYRRPFTRELLQGVFPSRRWADSDGLSAHLAVMTPDARMVWGAATLPDPIGTVAACSGSLAVGYTTLDDPTVVAAGAWTWRWFGFSTAPRLPYPISIGCADVDLDGATEPYIHRSTAMPEGTSP